MPVTINGTTGITGPDGSASTPSLAGADSNTGMFFPAADTIAFAEGGTEVMRIDSSGEVTRFNTNPGGMTIKRTDGVNSNGWLNFVGSDDVVDGSVRMATDAANTLTFLTAATERARITSGGNFLWGATALSNVSAGNADAKGIDYGDGMRLFSSRASTSSREHVVFYNPNGDVGSIDTSSTSTSYTTSSDYRLKEDIQPMAGALAKVAALKPVTYKWKVDGSDGEGFIAHELQSVVPACVTGEKDAVDDDGNPRYQGIDTSFLVATLTAAIQELRGIVDSQAARIAALEGAAQ
jgi:hypothetical protein